MFGVLAVNKPPGVTSRDVVNRVQWHVKPDKAGHTGTLDPMATGLLLIAVGRATRLVEFSHEQSKEYEAEFRLGVESDTLDADSPLRVLEQAPQPTAEGLAAEVRRWVGTIRQTPPKYSAVHVGGKRAYQLARQGDDFELPSRAVEVQAIEIVDYSYPTLTLRIQCGSGTYIRSLGSDIAKSFGSNAVMTKLVRTRMGSIAVGTSCGYDALTDAEVIAAALLPAKHLVEHLPTIELDASMASQIRNGIPLNLQATAQQLAAVDAAGELVAILGPLKSGVYRSLRVFQIESAVIHPKSNRAPHRPES